MAKKQVSDARLRALAAKKTRQEIALITGLHYDTVRKRLKKLGIEPKTDASKQVVTSESVRADIATLVAKQKATQNAKKLRVIAKELVRVEKELEALKGVKGVEIHSIKGKKLFNKSEATAILLASDWHYEENVKLSQTNGLNEFNRTIAKERIEKLFKVVVKLIEVHQREYNIDNFVLALLGDFISGSIHDDLMEGNEIQPTQAIYEVQCLIAGGIKYLLENTNVNLTIPCSSGNHCVEEETEILTSDGFKRAKDISDKDILASFVKETGEITYDLVEAIEKFSASGAYKVSGKHKNELVTPKHNLVINGEFVPVDTFKYGKRDDFRHTGYTNQQPLNLTDDELRLITWVVADGTMVDNSKYVKGSTKRLIQFKLSKTRKIDELRELLTRMGIKFTFKPATMSASNVLQPYYIRIYGDDARKIYSYFGEKKVFPVEFKQLSKNQLLIVCETIAITDGRYNGGSIEWSSIEKENIDTIQIACINNGVTLNYTAYNRVGGFSAKRKRLYIANIYVNGFNLDKNQKIKSRFINKEFNFVGVQTKNGTIITRRKGVINFTGNSRITPKIRVSTAFGNSLEFLMYRQLRDYFENEKRIKFIINDSYLTYMDIYDYKIRLHHGDAMRYGGGIGGLFIPTFKAISQWDKQIQADWTFFGHFHQLKDGGNFISNGSLIGFSPYAIRIKADYEKPKQAFLIIDKERGLDVVRKITL